MLFNPPLMHTVGELASALVQVRVAVNQTSKRTQPSQPRRKSVAETLAQMSMSLTFHLHFPSSFL